MAENEPGPYLAGGFEGQVLVKGVDGSNRTFWTDGSNIAAAPPVSNYEIITEDRHYYVAPTGGSDANNGLSEAKPFATLQKACSVVAGLHAGAFRVIVHANFTGGDQARYPGPITLPNSPYYPRAVGDNKAPFFMDAGSVPQSTVVDCVISSTTGPAITVNGHWEIGGLGAEIMENATGLYISPTGIVRARTFMLRTFPTVPEAEMIAGITVDGGKFFTADSFLPIFLLAGNAFIRAIHVINGGEFRLLPMPSGIMWIFWGQTYSVAAVETHNNSIIDFGAADLDGSTLSNVNLGPIALGISELDTLPVGRQYLGTTNSRILVGSGQTIPADMPGVLTSGATYNGRGMSTPQPTGGALAANLSGALFTNEGATAISVFTLPPLDTLTWGSNFSFYIQNAFGIRIVAAAGDTIRVAATASAAAGNVSATVIGNSIKLESINGTEWVATAVVGTWTVT